MPEFMVSVPPVKIRPTVIKSVLPFIGIVACPCMAMLLSPFRVGIHAAGYTVPVDPAQLPFKQNCIAKIEVPAKLLEENAVHAIVQFAVLPPVETKCVGVPADHPPPVVSGEAVVGAKSTNAFPKLYVEDRNPINPTEEVPPAAALYPGALSSVNVAFAAAVLCATPTTHPLLGAEAPPSPHRPLVAVELTTKCPRVTPDASA